MTALEALKELQKQLHAHVKLDVRKHYSLMVADAAASAVIAKAESAASDPIERMYQEAFE
jgi:hypothetical protein